MAVCRRRPERPSRKEPTEKLRRVIRDPDNLVRCLTIELEIELGLGAAILPVGKGRELLPPQTPLRERGPSDGDAHARCLAGDPALPRNRDDRGDDAFRDDTCPAFVLAREDEDRIAGGDVLAAIHGLLRAEGESSPHRISHL